jgi:hypothetical protein
MWLQKSRISGCLNVFLVYHVFMHILSLLYLMRGHGVLVIDGQYSGGSEHFHSILWPLSSSWGLFLTVTHPVPAPRIKSLL